MDTYRSGRGCQAVPCLLTRKTLRKSNWNLPIHSRVVLFSAELELKYSNIPGIVKLHHCTILAFEGQFGTFLLALTFSLCVFNLLPCLTGSPGDAKNSRAEKRWTLVC